MKKKKVDLSLKEIYPKPEKYKLFLEKDGLQEIWDKAKEKVSKELFNGNSKNKNILIDFIALEIIDSDNNYKISNERLQSFKDIANISNDWLRWSLSNERDIKDFVLIASGIDVFKGDAFEKFVKHKLRFAKAQDIDIKTEEVDLMYYKLYKFHKDLEYSSFDKEYEFFKDLPETLKKVLYTKDIQSIEQLNFYKDVVDGNRNELLSMNASNFLLNIPYKYIEEFDKYGVDVKKLLDTRMFSSQTYMYKLIEYSTKDESLKLFLKGLSKISYGAFEQNIDPRITIEDQISSDYLGSNTEVKYDENNKTYIRDMDGYKMRIYEDVNVALEKFHNDHIKAMNSDKFTFENEDFRFTLDKLNVPYVNGTFEAYTFETHAALIKSPTSGAEIFNSEILTEGFKRSDCSTPFKSNYLLGWEMIELVSLHPEDNVYVIFSDTKGKEIASMFVSKVNGDLVVDSVQYIQDLNLLKEKLNPGENIEDHYRTKIHELITMWACECISHPKGPKTIFFGNGGDGDSPKLRLTNKVANKIGAIIPDKTLDNEKMERFLVVPQHPHTSTSALDYEGSVEDEVARVIISKDPRYLNYKEIKETIMANLERLPDSYDKKETIISNIEQVSKDYKKYNKERKSSGLGKFEIQEGIYTDSDSISKEYKEDKYSNSDFNIDFEDN